MSFGDAVLAVLEAAPETQAWAGRLTPVAVPWSELKRAPVPIFGVQDLPTLKAAQVVGVWEGDLSALARRERAQAGRDALLAALTPERFRKVGWTVPALVIRQLPLATDENAPLRVDIEIYPRR